MNYLSILMCSSYIKDDFLINKEYKFCMMCANTQDLFYIKDINNAAAVAQ